jgi:hypothetical protein
VNTNVFRAAHDQKLRSLKASKDRNPDMRYEAKRMFDDDCDKINTDSADLYWPYFCNEFHAWARNNPILQVLDQPPWLPLSSCPNIQFLGRGNFGSVIKAKFISGLLTDLCSIQPLTTDSNFHTH